MRKTILAITVLTMLLLAAAAAQGAADIPDPPREFYCLDQAEVLSAGTENAIISSGRELSKATGAQIVVVTINSLGDAAVEDYANELFRKSTICPR